MDKCHGHSNGLLHIVVVQKTIGSFKSQMKHLVRIMLCN